MKVLINKNEYKIRKIYNIILILIEFNDNFVIFYFEKSLKYRVLYTLFQKMLLFLMALFYIKIENSVFIFVKFYSLISIIILKINWLTSFVNILKSINVYNPFYPKLIKSLEL